MNRSARHDPGKPDRVSIEQAVARQWDVVLVGSSFASMFFLLGLPRHLSVLVVESGDVAEHSDIVEGRLNTSVDVAQNNHSSLEKTWVKNSVFGGNSNCW